MSPPPASYARWWVDVEKCSGLTGEFARVTWYVVPAVASFSYRGTEANGLWWSTHDIVVAGAVVTDSMVVRHEMLHDILGSPDHPYDYFLDKCWGIVSVGGP